MNQQTFLDRAVTCQITDLFDHVAGYSFFAKNVDGEIMIANRGFYGRFGYTSKSEIIGKKDIELFPAGLADNFRRDDLRVMESDEPLLGIIELFFNRQGLPDWYLTNKIPVHDSGGGVIGVMGTVRSYAGQAMAIQPFVQIESAVEHIRNNFREKISVNRLAQRTGLSRRQLDRKFQEAFGISPQQFIIKTRVQAACEALADAQAPIVDVAFQHGFCDQSSFTKHFRRHMGVTPLQFRRQIWQSP
jgi:AraC-like DNA-binding protein